MRAIGLDRYGGPEVLHPVDLPEPHAGRGEIRIKVHAAGVAPADAMLRTGLLVAQYDASDPPYVPGMEVAGVIDEVGPACPLPATVGTEAVAFVDCNGSYGGYSEYVVVRAQSATRAPENATMAESASFLLNALTARNALDAVALPAGSSLLITGAAGSVGGYLTQLATRAGLRVIAVVAPQDTELVRSFGADLVVPRGADAPRRVREIEPGGVDAAVDTASIGEPLLDAIRDGGQLAVLRPFTGRATRGITVHRLNVRDRAIDHEAIAALRELVEDGVLPLRVAHVLPAGQAAEAHRLLDSGTARGRIILEMPVDPATAEAQQ